MAGWVDGRMEGWWPPEGHLMLMKLFGTSICAIIGSCKHWVPAHIFTLSSVSSAVIPSVWLKPNPFFSTIRTAEPDRRYLGWKFIWCVHPSLNLVEVQCEFIAYAPASHHRGNHEIIWLCFLAALILSIFLSNRSESTELCFQLLSRFLSPQKGK